VIAAYSAVNVAHTRSGDAIVNIAAIRNVSGVALQQQQ
jgi:hypothetical protein